MTGHNGLKGSGNPLVVEPEDPDWVVIPPLAQGKVPPIALGQAKTPPPEFALEPVTYKGPYDIAGDPRTVAQIHRTNRLFDLLGTAVLAALAGFVVAVCAVLVIFAPPSHDHIVLGMVATGWIVAFSLGGFAAFRVKLSPSGIDMMGSPAGIARKLPKTKTQ
jgi:hypothetical protein